MDNPLVFHSHSETETEQFAARFAADVLKPGDFLAFFGDLGSGKTAFVRGVAAHFCPGVRVSSPTYALVNEYRGHVPVFHFDLYRITDDDSLYATGFYDYFDRGGILAAEWCENIPFALPVPRYNVVFEKTGETERTVTVTLFDGSFP